MVLQIRLSFVLYVIPFSDNLECQMLGFHLGLDSKGDFGMGQLFT